MNAMDNEGPGLCGMGALVITAVFSWTFVQSTSLPPGGRGQRQLRDSAGVVERLAFGTRYVTGLIAYRTLTTPDMLVEVDMHDSRSRLPTSHALR